MVWIPRDTGAMGWMHSGTEALPNAPRSGQLAGEPLHCPASSCPLTAAKSRSNGKPREQGFYHHPRGTGFQAHETLQTKEVRPPLSLSNLPT